MATKTSNKLINTNSGYAMLYQFSGGSEGVWWNVGVKHWSLKISYHSFLLKLIWRRRLRWSPLKSIKRLKFMKYIYLLPNKHVEVITNLFLNLYFQKYNAWQIGYARGSKVQTPTISYLLTRCPLKFEFFLDLNWTFRLKPRVKKKISI